MNDLLQLRLFFEISSHHRGVDPCGAKGIDSNVMRGIVESYAFGQHGEITVE